MRLILVLVMASGLMTWTTSAHAQMQLSVAQRTAVQTGVRETLLDPPSARFGPMRAGREGGAILVCGTVSAKNRYGGYTGQRPFIGRLMGTRYESISPFHYWPALCHGIKD